ncbi:hypothetical protein E2C01_069992 [Portunus trituberculatus]|uniref:Secreted protein n=1 Tax=Portunus trituberculatus TaxID=210409 RepID=A0A5B7HW06_PORTR|nr:hypothetical protein [Portunus trituberculatus]
MLVVVVEMVAVVAEVVAGSRSVNPAGGVAESLRPSGAVLDKPGPTSALATAGITRALSPRGPADEGKRVVVVVVLVVVVSDDLQMVSTVAFTSPWPPSAAGGFVRCSSLLNARVWCAAVLQACWMAVAR